MASDTSTRSGHRRLVPPRRGGWGLPLVVLIAGMFMSVLDISIVNVAILTMQNDFGVTTDEIQWVATSYELALGVVVPVSGWLGDRFGPTRVYIIVVGRLRRLLRALRAGLEPGEHDRLPGAAGGPGRHPAAWSR